MKRIILTVIMLVILLQVGAYSIMDMKDGNEVYGGDARMLSMGSAGIISRNIAGAVTLNPGLISRQPLGIYLQLSGNGTFNGENRSIPMYNFFDGYIDDANYAGNTSGYEEMSAKIGYNYKTESLKIGINFGWGKVRDFESNYEEQVRNDGNTDSGNSGDNSPDGYPPIIAKNYLESEGDLGGFNLGLGISISDMVGLGMNIQQLQGDWEAEKRIEWTEAARNLAEGLEDYNLSIDGEFEDAYRLGLGMWYQLNDRIGMGISMKMKKELERDIGGTLDAVSFEEIIYDTLTVNGELDTLYWQDKMEAEYGMVILPDTYRVGIEYHPRNRWETFFNFDLEYVKYTQVDKRYSDVTNYYLGVEHRVNQKLPLRFGFNYKTSYYIFEDGEDEFARRITMPSFTAGTGFEIIHDLSMDLGIEYSMRKYEQLDLFQDSYYAHDDLWNEIEPSDRGWENPDQVDESLITFQASLTWHWKVNND